MSWLSFANLIDSDGKKNMKTQEHKRQEQERPQNDTCAKRVPDFIGIGAEKAGTTWLWDQLSKHPDIAMPYPKELRYFAYRDYAPNMDLAATSYLLKNKPEPGRAPVALLSAINELRCRFGTIEDYLNIFGELPQKKVVGEISPQYASLSIKSIQQIYGLRNKMIIIYIIRDPVERAISGAKMKLSEQNEELSEDSIIKSATGKLQTMLSDYKHVIDNYRVFFERENFKIFAFDDLKESPSIILRELCSSFKIEYKEDYFKRSQEKVFPGAKVQLSDQALRQIYQHHSKVYDDLMEEFPALTSQWRSRYV